MKSFKEFITEATIKSNGTSIVSLVGNNLTIKLSDISGGANTNWGEPIKSIYIEIKTGGNDLPWPLFALGGLSKNNSPITANIPGQGGNKGSIYYSSDYITTALIGAGDQEDKAQINGISIKDNTIVVTFSAAKSSDLEGEYKSFVVEVKMKSVFGPKGESIISDIESSNWTNEKDFHKKFSSIGNLKNSENVNIKFKTR
mgnify:CR=1 FL=1